MIVVDCCEQRNMLLLDLLQESGRVAMSLEEYMERGHRCDIDLVLAVGSKLPLQLSSLVERKSRVFYLVNNEGLDRLECSKIHLLKVPSFVTANSYLTAEGALGLVITNTDIALKDANVCVTGWGYLAKECVKMIGKLSGSLTVMARSRTAREQAKQLGYRAVDISDELSEFDIIINTIPAKIFGEPKLKQGVFILELASKIYPFDYDDFGENVRYLIAKAVPSKMSSRSAARLLMDTIIAYKE